MKSIEALEKTFWDKISTIGTLSEKARQKALARQHDLAKPRGSLGRLEELAVKIAAIQDTDKPRHENKLMVVCAGDHGIVEEGVSPFPQDVTRQQISNFSQGGGAITVLCRQVGAKVILADVGVNYDFPDHPMIRKVKVAKGTKNMTKGPAMTREETLKAILVGMEIVEKEKKVDFIAAGEMGIGNTSPSSAICSLLIGCSVAEATGVGSGLNDAQVAHKIAVIQKAIDINKPDQNDPLDILAKVGGLEIAAMTGVMLGAAQRRAVVFIDGFIAGAAALLAEKIKPGVKDFFVGGHKSKEKAHATMLEHLNIKPLLDLDLHLGEGSGAAIAMFVGQCACTHHNEMKTLAEAMIYDTII